jgi:hypothetical protein
MLDLTAKRLPTGYNMTIFHSSAAVVDTSVFHPKGSLPMAQRTKWLEVTPVYDGSWNSRRRFQNASDQDTQGPDEIDDDFQLCLHDVSAAPEQGCSPIDWHALTAAELADLLRSTRELRLNGTCRELHACGEQLWLQARACGAYTPRRCQHRDRLICSDDPPEIVSVVEAAGLIEEGIEHVTSARESTACWSSYRAFGLGPTARQAELPHDVADTAEPTGHSLPAGDAAVLFNVTCCDYRRQLMWHSDWLIARPVPALSFTTASASVRPIGLRTELLSFRASAGVCAHVVELGVLSDADLSVPVPVRHRCSMKRAARLLQHCATCDMQRGNTQHTTKLHTAWSCMLNIVQRMPCVACCDCAQVDEFVGRTIAPIIKALALLNSTNDAAGGEPAAISAVQPTYFCWTGAVCAAGRALSDVHEEWLRRIGATGRWTPWDEVIASREVTAVAQHAACSARRATYDVQCAACNLIPARQKLQLAM